VASSKDRQRKLARAKLDRQMARRAGRVRRRRQIQAGVGAVVALLLIVGGAAWLSGAFDSDDQSADTASDLCNWTAQSAQTNTDLKEVGTPPTTGMPTSGTEPMTITTNQGVLTVSLDAANAPCSAADLSYLAGRQFYDNTECHEITTEGALHCGDPAGNGLGGPTYTFYDENIPVVPTPAPSASAAPAAAAKTPPLYPKGTVALIGNPPGNNGSQFLVFLKDFTTTSPKYPIVGTVTGGTDTLAKIAKIATVDNGSGSKVKPKEKITIQSLTVGTSTGADAGASAAPSASSQS
jgi:peptidyl-prolyl cis-trans isomerase B (cyclophilin B)